jgi:hypothetical protein
MTEPIPRLQDIRASRVPRRRPGVGGGRTYSLSAHDAALLHQELCRIVEVVNGGGRDQAMILFHCTDETSARAIDRRIQ